MIYGHDAYIPKKISSQVGVRNIVNLLKQHIPSSQAWWCTLDDVGQ